MKPVLRTLVLATLALAGLWACARLPVTTRVVHEDARVGVTLQREITSPGYGHPVRLTAAEVAALLRGISLRREVRLPLRWFERELPPRKAFREDELSILAAPLIEALALAGPDERVSFELRAPGMNPPYEQDLTAGWIAVRGAYFHIGVEFWHSQQPVSRSSPYDYNYPTPRSAPESYVLYFEPGRFWVIDDALHRRAVDLRPFLQSMTGIRP